MLYIISVVLLVVLIFEGVARLGIYTIEMRMQKCCDRTSRARAERCGMGHCRNVPGTAAKASIKQTLKVS